MNWVHNSIEKWASMIGLNAISNWHNLPAGSGTAPLDSIVYVPHRSYRKWVRTRTNIKEYSKDGWAWQTAGGPLPANAVAGAITCFNDGAAVIGTADGFTYQNGASFTAWNNRNNAALGTSGGVYALECKADDSMFMIVDQYNTVRYAATPWSSFSSPTTPPVATSGGKKRLVYAEGSTWYLLSQDTAASDVIYRTTDDGVTWSSLTNQPTFVGSRHLNAIAYDYQAQRLVVAGNTSAIATSAVPQIEYTDNAGATAWNVSTFTEVIAPTGNHCILVDVWFAGRGHYVIATSESQGLLVSCNGGEHWTYSSDLDGFANDTFVGRCLGCDGNKIIVVGGITGTPAVHAGYCVGPGRRVETEGL
jgi:hypothetical protein